MAAFFGKYHWNMSRHNTRILACLLAYILTVTQGIWIDAPFHEESNIMMRPLQPWTHQGLFGETIGHRAGRKWPRDG